MNKGFIKGKNENEVIPSEDLGTDKKNIETKEKRHIIGTREETNVEKGEHMSIEIIYCLKKI